LKENLRKIGTNGRFLPFDRKAPFDREIIVYGHKDKALWVVLFWCLMGQATGKDHHDDWQDTPLDRLKALATLQSLALELLTTPSATVTLEHWCAAHHLAESPQVSAAVLPSSNQPVPGEIRGLLRVSSIEPIRHRHVQLRCGGQVLSEAENWYLPQRLTRAMNQTLDNSNQPFGRVVQPLHFRRVTLTSAMLWQPLPEPWEAQDFTAGGSPKPLAIPFYILENRVLLIDAQGQPLSALVEKYTRNTLNYPHPKK
jgi:chorismate-pyruvate lyase